MRLSRPVALALGLFLLGAPLPGALGNLTCGPSAQAAPPVGNPPCPGVRPGALFTTPTSADSFQTCTFAFLYAGSDGRRYAATAGHCAFPDSEHRSTTWRGDDGPVATGDSGKPVGRFAFASAQAVFDFGLVRLDRGVASNPQMCHFGGPTLTRTDVNNTDMLTHYVGRGYGVSSVASARTGESPYGLQKPDHMWFHGAFSIGDSGGPVTDDAGGAVGVITDFGAGAYGNVLVNRLGPALDAATKVLGVRFTLLTAPTL